jgi:hypothetical protein
VICANCHAHIATASEEIGSTNFGRAVLFGLAASAVCATAYFALLAATGREISALVLLIGFVVGKAVRVGSKGRGGRRFQWLAVGLTYLAIAATYVPFVMKGFSSTSSANAIELLPATTSSGSLLVTPVSMTSAPPPASLGRAAVDYSALLLLAAAAPILEGLRNVIMLLLTVAAMFQAWRMNRRVAMTISGPYRVRT